MEVWPAVAKVIKDILPTDGRVKIAGTIISVDSTKGAIKVDDGTGMTDITFKAPGMVPKIERYNSGDQVVVIGWPARKGEEGLEGDILSRVTGFEPDRYRQVMEVWEHVRSETEESDGFGQPD
ncbi:MAG TPA: hypothetical protein ENN60_01470 [archaeon]|nr:hypothetical protein [archaeon]